MIPIKLELQNFLAYRSQQSVDLSGLHLACLAGTNGAGKSALLDAMTWAIWGKARAQRDDELIHGDETEMMVQLEFSQEGLLYRVSRYRSRTGRGRSELQLEIRDGDQWRNISESTIRATQEKIIRLLRLDYATFINSAFLMQGRADEFTNKTPGERKVILSEILGLNQWAKYEERARQRLREIEGQTDQLEGLLAGVERDLSEEDSFQRELIAAQQALAGISQQVHEADIHVRDLENARHERDKLQTAMEQAVRYAQQAELELDRIDQERREQIRRLADFEAILSQREAIEADYAALVQARETDRYLSDRLIERTDLIAQRMSLEQTIHSARALLEADLRSLRQRLADLERAIEEADPDALADFQSRITALEKREVDLAGLRSEHSGVVERYAQLEANNRSLKREMEGLRQQLDMIQATQEPVCPLCQQDLSETHREELIARLQEAGEHHRQEWQAGHDEAKTLKGEVARLAREINLAEQDLRNLGPTREHYARLRDREERAEAARTELREVVERIAAVEQQIALESYAAEERAALQANNDLLEALGYDEAAHQAARLTLERLAQIETIRADMQRAANEAPSVESALASLDEQSARWQGALAEARAQSESVDEEVSALDRRLAELQPWEERLARLRDEEGRARYRVGAAQQKLHALEQQRQRRVELLAERDRLAEEHAIYEELRAAFGRDGVPSLIIEAAIPEIEQEANDILARMTDGRMHVRFDTQREKVSGGVRETLDIKIADELGTRDYATFSGGEAFRVNFAIRLALSRLLARRAGAQLRTLIIDEGFGTQDSQGRERLVMAINAIQDEFDLILVITHIDELKEAFPVRIEVTKTPQGSVVEVI